jgi:rhomboid protease GluP
MGILRASYTRQRHDWQIGEFLMHASRVSKFAPSVRRAFAQHLFLKNFPSMSSNPEDTPSAIAILPNGREAAVVGRYALRTEAYDHALVVSSMEIAHWILRDGEMFLLCVELAHAEMVSRELCAWDQQPKYEAATFESAPNEKSSPISLFIAGWSVAIFFFIQGHAPDWWSDAGANSSLDVLRGQWWRVFTALTLHADFSHVGANLAAGLVCAGFLLPIFGGGWTWFLIVLSGALGNWLNAWGHRGETHISIGSSTAVFGALGILVGAQCVQRILAVRRVRAGEALLPLGAGFALLAFLGVGDAQTDYTAHLCGLVVGIVLGGAGVFLRLKKRTSRAVQTALGFASLALPVVAWVAATVAQWR